MGALGPMGVIDKASLEPASRLGGPDVDLVFGPGAPSGEKKGNAGEPAGPEAGVQKQGERPEVMG